MVVIRRSTPTEKLGIILGMSANHVVIDKVISGFPAAGLVQVGDRAVEEANVAQPEPHSARTLDHDSTTRCSPDRTRLAFLDSALSHDHVRVVRGVAKGLLPGATHWGEWMEARTRREEAPRKKIDHDARFLKTPSTLHPGSDDAR